MWGPCPGWPVLLLGSGESLCIPRLTLGKSFCLSEPQFSHLSDGVTLHFPCEDELAAGRDAAFLPLSLVRGQVSPDHTYEGMHEWVN